MRRLGVVVALALIAGLIGSVWADELAQLTVKGKLVKKDIEGAPEYVVACSDGSEVSLPKAGEGVDLEKFVDKQVEVVGKGTKALEDGKEVVKLQELVSVQEAK